jgi:Zn-finger nucleic acid-binding protein
MNCPVCNVELKMTDRQGVEIDYCPKCRGVWLDRGELDKIIERSETGVESSERDRYDEHNRQRSEQHRHSDEHNRHSDQRSYYPQQPYKKHKKKESFLSNLFDFD